MDATKLETSGEPVKVTLSSYKQVPESDEEDMSKAQDNKVKGKPDAALDGADEKMLPDSDTNVKFVTNEKQNGEAKVDIGELKSAFVGMGKEELMKYANDPFWVRLRWVLFVGFWLVWIGMLAGAIAIIIVSPKCSPPQPRTWWEQGPLTQLEQTATLDELKQVSSGGFKGVIVPWDGDVYSNINESPLVFIDFIKLAQEAGINVIVDLAPGNSANWFYKSATNEDGGKYADYYIWANPRGTDGSGTVNLPNNWKSKRNVSAWKFSKERNQFYLAPDDAPKLNFTNPKVVEEFAYVLKRVLELGANGVRLQGAPQLLVDDKLEDELISTTPGFGHTDYGFYSHTHTEYLPGLTPLIQKWSDVFRNGTDRPFMLQEHLKTLDVFVVNGTLTIDLPSCSRVFGPDKQLTATQIDNDLTTAFRFLDNNKYWPIWEHNNTGLPADVLDIVTSFLPGTVLARKDFPVQISKLRNSPSIMYGNTTKYLMANESVFAFGRSVAGNPGYLIALNPTTNQRILDFSKDVPDISEEVTVQYFSRNYNETDIEIKKKTRSNAVPISAESAIVVSYVPKA